MYLIDTNVLSEARKGARANSGVIEFFRRAASSGDPLYLASVTLGEVRRGVEMLRRRGNSRQAERLDRWLKFVLGRYNDAVLSLDLEAALVWGRLRVPDPSHVVDKQIAAIALVNNLTVVTRNTGDFVKTGARILNPFSADPGDA